MTFHFSQISNSRRKCFGHSLKRYPNLKCIARHVRYAHSCSENSLSSIPLVKMERSMKARDLTFHILDRVGGGDAFVSGIIYGLMNELYTGGYREFRCCSKCSEAYNSW